MYILLYLNTSEGLKFVFVLHLSIFFRYITKGASIFPLKLSISQPHRSHNFDGRHTKIQAPATVLCHFLHSPSAFNPHVHSIVTWPIPKAMAHGPHGYATCPDAVFLPEQFCTSPESRRTPFTFTFFGNRCFSLFTSRYGRYMEWSENENGPNDRGGHNQPTIRLTKLSISKLSGHRDLTLLEQCCNWGWYYCECIDCGPVLILRFSYHTCCVFIIKIYITSCHIYIILIYYL